MGSPKRARANVASESIDEPKLNQTDQKTIRCTYSLPSQR